MLVAIGYYNGDLDQAERLAGWLKEIGPFPGHRLLVARDTGTDATPFADAGFDRVEEIVISDDVWRIWPTSANNVFKKIATHIERVDKAPYWLWLEPDAVPIRQDAFDALEAEYVAAGQLFSGDKVSVDSIPTHMSGIAIYPGEVSRHFGEAKIAFDLAWDMAIRDQSVPNMHISKHILHAWKHPVFGDMAAVQREIFAFKPECLLFHASKDGSLIEILRAERNQTLPAVPVLAECERPAESSTREEANEARESTTSATSGFTADSRGGGQFICDILIKTFPTDYERLVYCLRSISKFATGFRRLVIVYPDGAEMPPFDGAANYRMPLFTPKVVELGDGYAFQQAVKANAHDYTDADYILHIDSDCCLTGPITPEMFFRDGKPIWLMTPYDQTATPWREPTEKFLGEPVDYEFMRRMPMFVPRAIHVAAAAFCQAKHGMPLADYIMSQEKFSEFNALGALAYARAREDFTWIDTAKDEMPQSVCIQLWSRGEFTHPDRAAFEKILSGGGMELSGEPASPDDKPGHRTPPSEPPRKRGRPPGTKMALGTSLPAWEKTEKDEIKPYKFAPVFDPDKQVPWASPLDSMEEIRTLAGRLAQFCTAPAFRNAVRTELALVKVIKGRRVVKRRKFAKRKVKYYFDENGMRIPTPSGMAKHYHAGHK